MSGKDEHLMQIKRDQSKNENSLMQQPKFKSEQDKLLSKLMNVVVETKSDKKKDKKHKKKHHKHKKSGKQIKNGGV